MQTIAKRAWHRLRTLAPEYALYPLIVLIVLLVMGAFTGRFRRRTTRTARTPFRRARGWKDIWMSTRISHGWNWRSTVASSM